MTAKKWDVFISYTHADAAEANRLEETLRAEGLSVFRDISYQLPGDEIALEVNEALFDAETVVVLWSKNSVGSRWVAFEAGVARAYRMAAPLKLGDISSADLPQRLRGQFFRTLDEILADPSLLKEKIAETRAHRLALDKTRLIEVSGLPRAPNRFIGRTGELDRLRDAWATGAPRILSFIAAGGSGKTALSQAFLDEMTRIGWGGAEAVFAFSFDSQGADETKQSASDRFFSEALTLFGVDPQGDGLDTVRKRADRLAGLLETRRTLFILDGVEPMQQPRGDAEHGRFRDDAIREFLIAIARRNKGLCIVTSRMSLADLAGFDADCVDEIRLANLPLADAVALLRLYEVDYPQEEMEALVRDYGQVLADPDGRGAGETRCHAKAIALIGSYLRRTFAGAQHKPTLAEIRDAFAMPEEAFLGETDAALEDEPGYAVYRMIRRYERMYEARAKEHQKALTEDAAGRQLALLRVMGLFDRPASWGAFQAVLAPPALPGITDGLERVSSGEWKQAIIALRRDGLLNPSPDGQTVLDPAHALDAHPLIREYFARRLKLTDAYSFGAAHERLYDYYRYRGLPAAFQEPVAYAALGIVAAFPENRAANLRALSAGLDPGGDIPPTLTKASTDERKRAALMVNHVDWDSALANFLPTDEAGMAPLFAAIAHGCAAGRHDDAFQEVYWPRIARGNKAYAVRALGLYGSDLSALAQFFATPFEEPAEGLPPARQALLFGQAAFRLRALGRLADAVAPARGAVAAYVALGDAKRVAATAASNLSELLLALGRLADAPDGAAGAVSAAAQSIEFADESEDPFRRLVTLTTHADALHHQGDRAAAAARFEGAEARQRADQPIWPLLSSLQGARCCDLKLAQGRRAEAAARAADALPLGERNDWLLTVGFDKLTLGRAAHQAAREGAAPFEAALAALDQAVEALRDAASLDDMPKGWLARAACRREAGLADPARADLGAARDVARRGGMRLALVDCAIEAAWQALDAANHAAEEAARMAALQQAEDEIKYVAAEIEAIRYGRRKPDLALLRATLAGMRGRREAALIHFEPLLAAIQDDNLWSFLPDLDHLAEHFEIPELDEMRAELRRRRAAFDAAEDAKFAAARAYPDWLSDAAMDRRLADPSFRDLADRLARANERPLLDALTFAQQRDWARTVAWATRYDEQQEHAPAPTLDPRAIPEELVEQALGHANFRELIETELAKAGLPELDALSPDHQREAARSMLAMVIDAQQKPAPTAAAPERAEPSAPPAEEPTPRPAKRSLRERLGLSKRKPPRDRAG